MVRSSWKLYYIVFERDVIRLVEQAVCRGRRSVIQRCRAITLPTHTYRDYGGEKNRTAGEGLTR